MLVELVGQSVRNEDDVAADPGRLVNCYRVGLSDGRKVMRSTLGMEAFGGVTGTLARAMAEVSGTLYVVYGGALWEVAASGASVSLGAIPDSEETTLAGNNGKVTICADGRYFVWDGAVLSEPSTGAFSAFGSVDFIGQLTVLTEKDGRRLQWSGLVDPETLGGLDFATTESRDDNNVRGMTFGPEYWVFKQKSTERWYLAEDGNLRVIPGTTIDKGLLAFGLVCRCDLGGFFVATDGKVYACSPGGALTQVSTPAVHAAIAQGSPSQCLYWRDRGHEFCAVVFDDRPAWVYDVTMGEWHERATGADGAWIAQRAQMAYGQAFVAGHIGGLRKLVATNVDDSGPLVRRMITRAVGMDGNRFRVKALRWPLRTGYDDATVMLTASGDRGVTFGAPKERTVTLGNYVGQIIWRMLGQFRFVVFELRITDPVEIPVESYAYLDPA